MSVFKSVYHHIVALGGLIEKESNGTSAILNSSSHERNESAKKLRQQWANEYMQVRNDVAAMILDLTKNGKSIDPPTRPTRIKNQLDTLEKTKSKFDRLSDAEVETIADIISRDQIAELISDLDHLIVSPDDSHDATEQSVTDDRVAVSENDALDDAIYNLEYVYADILIALAQADKKIDIREKELLNGIFAKMDLKSGCLEKMWITPRTIDVIDAILGNIDDLTYKCCLLKDCYLLAYADETFQPEEMDFITHILSVIDLGYHLEEAIHKWSKTAIQQNHEAEMLFGRYIDN